MEKSLTVTDIVSMIEAGKIVTVPCVSKEEAEIIRNNISSRLYKQRAQMREAIECEFQSLRSELCYEVGSTSAIIGIRFRLVDKQQASYRCTVVDPEEETHG